jgi:uncharacterized protein YciI
MGEKMFVVVMRFSETLDLEDERVQGHRSLTRELVAAGQVVLAGPRNPRVGGLMVFDVPTEEELQALLARDPMRIAGLIEDEIFDFAVTAAVDEKHLDSSVIRA